MHFSHSSDSVPADTTLDRKMWRKRMGTCRQSFVTLRPSTSSIDETSQNEQKEADRIARGLTLDGGL